MLVAPSLDPQAFFCETGLLLLLLDLGEFLDCACALIAAMNRLKHCLFMLLVLAAGLYAQTAQTPAAPQQQQQQQPEFIRKGQQLMREGKLDEALSLFQDTLKTSPDSLPATNAAGVVLDLMGKGDEARKYFSKAIEMASTPQGKARATSTMAMSWAFEGNCKKTIEYEQQAFDINGQIKDCFQQGEVADEGARVCIDTGDLDAAFKWYKTGHDIGLKEPDIKPDRQDLWEFRWEHAQARIAAR